MAKLKPKHQTFIVTRLACFVRAPDVVEAVRETFGIAITTDQVHYYDPENVHGRKPAEKWVKLHDKARQAFLDDVSSIPIANRSWRLGELQKLYDKTKSPVLKKELMAQAADELREVPGTIINDHSDRRTVVFAKIDSANQ